MSNPNRPNRPSVQPTPVPLPEVVTADHLHNVLDVIAGLEPFLLNAPGDHLGAPETRRLDEKSEAGIAAEATFIRACSRLDSLLDDPERWGLGAHQKLYDLLNANYAQQFEFLKSQTAASNSLSRPFFLLKPELVQTEDGEFVAYFGNVSTPGMGLLGRGKTPAEAFADFDAAFFRSEQHLLEVSPEQPPKKPSRKKK